MKKCNKCGEEKSFHSFSFDRYKKDECSTVCKVCKSLYKKSYLSKNKGKESERKKQWYQDNKEKARAKGRAYYYENLNSQRETRRRYYRENKRNFIIRVRLRERQVRQHMPKWLTFEQRRKIELVYEHARDCRSITGEDYHVDHIVPLRGENFCGLHVPWNLQVLPSDLNDSKGNKLIEELAVAHG